MRLGTPRFWYENKPSLWPIALTPLSWVYRLLHYIHQAMGKPYVSHLPVLCVGNLVAGGGGKTPACLALAALILKNRPGANPWFLTRGYGGRLKGPVRVDPSLHKAADVGDEALLLARTAPTIVAADRAEGAKFAERNGAGMIIMDDGLHNTRLAKTRRLVVIDGAAGLGNRRLLPAGPLRTPAERGLALADGFLLIGEDKTGIGPLLSGKPVFKATIESGAAPAPGKTYIAFSGIARPEKFFLMLEESGFALAGKHPFPDHHAFTAGDIATLKKAARTHMAVLATTEKDFMRLKDNPDLPQELEVIHIIISIQKEKDVLEWSFS